MGVPQNHPSHQTILNIETHGFGDLPLPFWGTTLFLEDSAAPEDLEPASTAWSVVHSASREGRRAVWQS